MSQSPYSALALARHTALQKPSSGVRGIATGDTCRRRVARTLARRYACRFDEATRPYQFVLQARAGTDCLAALLRAATELDPAATVVSLDGRCAYDSVSRAAFLDKLAEVTPSLVPCVRAFYARQSVYLSWDGAGAHRILEGDGCEQGDALAPALFALAQHAALVASGRFSRCFLGRLVYRHRAQSRARRTRSGFLCR